MDKPVPTTLGTSLACLEAEAAWFVSQGHDPEQVALWIDEPVEFVVNAVGDPEARVWHVWVYNRWQRRVTVVDDAASPTPDEIVVAAAECRKAAVVAAKSRRGFTDDELWAAMKAAHGRAYDAAVILKCHVSTVYERLKKV